MNKSRGALVQKKITKVENYEYKEFNHLVHARKATITFVNDKFNCCMYSGMNGTYSLEDWEFLKKLALEIERLVKQREATKKKGKSK